jgi:hypothetical protein
VWPYYPRCHANAINNRHSQIQQYDIRLVPFLLLDCLRAIPRLTDDHHILRFGQNGHEPIRNNRMSSAMRILIFGFSISLTVGI